MCAPAGTHEAPYNLGGRPTHAAGATRQCVGGQLPSSRTRPRQRASAFAPAGRVDEERLAAYAQEREHPPLPREAPDLIAVAEERSRGAGLEVPLVRVHPRGVLDPGAGKELLAAPVPVVGE